MAKFVLVKNYTGLDEIKEYMEKKQNANYYIAPKLMYEILGDARYRCVINLHMSDIKIRVHNKIDLLTISVYNKVFQREVYVVEALKDGYLIKANHDMYFDYVVFGIDKDLKDFTCDVEEL